MLLSHTYQALLQLAWYNFLYYLPRFRMATVPGTPAFSSQQMVVGSYASVRYLNMYS